MTDLYAEMLHQIAKVLQRGDPRSVEGDLRVDQQRRNVELHRSAFAHESTTAPLTRSLQGQKPARSRPGAVDAHLTAFAAGEVFVTIDPGAPDGIRTDRSGRLYSTAADGVHVFSSEGKLLGKVKTPETAANCTFGGPANNTLFITAVTSVWAVDLDPSVNSS